MELEELFYNARLFNERLAFHIFLMILDHEQQRSKKTEEQTL